MEVSRLAVTQNQVWASGEAGAVRLGVAAPRNVGGVGWRAACAMQRGNCVRLRPPALLAADTSQFGYRMLEKMGWSEGKGLGKNEQGEETHINVMRKVGKDGETAFVARASCCPQAAAAAAAAARTRLWGSLSARRGAGAAGPAASQAHCASVWLRCL